MPTIDLGKGVYTGSPIQIPQYGRKRLEGAETESSLSVG